MKSIKRLLAGIVLMSCTCTASNAQVNWEDYEFHPTFQLQYNTSTVELNSQNFDTVVKYEGVSVVFFYAFWCGPCKMMTPTITELANDFPSAVVGMLNVDAEEDICVNYGIKTIPTTLFFKNGELKESKIGVYSKQGLSEIMYKLLH